MNAIFVFVFAASDVLQQMLQWFYWDDKNNNLDHWLQSKVLITNVGFSGGMLLYTFIKLVFWFAVSGLLYKWRWFWKIWSYFTYLMSYFTYFDVFELSFLSHFSLISLSFSLSFLSHFSFIHFSLTFALIYLISLLTLINNNNTIMIMRYSRIIIIIIIIICYVCMYVCVCYTISYNVFGFTRVWSSRFHLSLSLSLSFSLSLCMHMRMCVCLYYIIHLYTFAYYK